VQVEEDYVYTQLKKRYVTHKHLSREEIEKEISTMVKNILRLIKDDDNEILFIVDGYCHFDVLFQK
jgi:hypothetical protein